MSQRDVLDAVFDALDACGKLEFFDGDVRCTEVKEVFMEPVLVGEDEGRKPRIYHRRILRIELEIEL